MFTNSLIHETSPYLLQHAHNPVDWMPWSDAAFGRAKQEDKPVFLSLGYSTCHWCHVMAHESFENEEVAHLLNKYFISIKVDREELPDVDEQYMLATQLLTRRGGGWPNSVWLTPDRKPWFAGTYFPREDHGAVIGFQTLLLRLAEAWQQHRSEVQVKAEQMADLLREVETKNQHALASTAEFQELSYQIVDDAIHKVGALYDPVHGGFGSRPKFPPHGLLSLLSYRYRKTRDSALLGMIVKTLEAMRQGGIYDQLGGGFHRYATDERWFLPHFEKMLYDNAQLIRIYTDGYELTGREDFRRVVRETFDWVVREMTDPAGGFYGALDADSRDEQGHDAEGKFYVWTPEQIVGVLGEEDGELFNTVYGVSREGNFSEEATGRRTGESLLFLPVSLDEMATNMKLDKAEFRQRVARMREKLLAEREKRQHPHRDDKVLTGWNGLMIGGLAHAGRVFEEPEYLDAAIRAAEFVLKNLRNDDGRLLRVWRADQAKIPAYLDDYAFFIQGLLELHRATGDSSWLDEAVVLADLMIIDFGNTVGGGFYMASLWHDALLVRSIDTTGGGNLPSGNGVVADVLTQLSMLIEEPAYVNTARMVFEAHDGAMREQPLGSEHLVLALAEYLDLKAEDKLPKFVRVEEFSRPEEGLSIFRN